MTSTSYINAVLTVIAILLLGILLQHQETSRASFPLAVVRPALAEQAEPTSGFEFHPVGNQQVRRFVFFDRANNVIYDYDSGGKLDKVWAIGELGSGLRRKN